MPSKPTRFPIKRRTAIQYLGALAGSAVAPPLWSGCGKPEEDRERVARGLTTIVTLCMENRSYDHYFGARSLLEGKGGDGLRPEMSNPSNLGQPIKVFATGAHCVADPPHGWESSHHQFNEGKNDGFVKAYAEEGMGLGPEAMGYMTRKQLPISWLLADSGTICDRWFCSVMGPTWPNRMYLHSAQSGGLKTNTLAGTGGFPWPSIYHRLDEAKVPWAYYYSTLPFVPLFRGLPIEGKVKRLENDFFDDAQAGTLPPVVFLDPAFDQNDDHPPLPPILGQQLIAAVYNALAASPQWPNILFVVTYDEHGGFFDHVAPPKAPDERANEGFDQLGFRVPTMIVGPYVKPGYVSSVVYDHTSVLAHIERMFNLKPLTPRDAAAKDLRDAIDEVRLSARAPLSPIKLPEISLDPSIFEGDCKKFLKRSDLVQLADTGYFQELDLRHRFPSLFQLLNKWTR